MVELAPRLLPDERGPVCRGDVRRLNATLIPLRYRHVPCRRRRRHCTARPAPGVGFRPARAGPGGVRQGERRAESAASRVRLVSYPLVWRGRGHRRGDRSQPSTDWCRRLSPRYRHKRNVDDAVPMTLCDGEVARSFRQYAYRGGDGAWVELSASKRRTRSVVVDARRAVSIRAPQAEAPQASSLLLRAAISSDPTWSSPGSLDTHACRGSGRCLVTCLWWRRDRNGNARSIRAAVLPKGKQ